MSNTTKRRFENAINASSMADIAFLLLIFFLVTTTILQDEGIMVQLPPYEENALVVALSEENVLTVLVNAKNQLFVEGEDLQIKDLREKTKNFILNPAKLKTLPGNPKQTIISLRNDRGTEYETYIAVYNELKAAYRELWDDLAAQRFGTSYAELSPKLQNQIRAEIPLVISEAEPTDYISQQ